MRIEHVLDGEQSAVVVDRATFDADRKHGFVCFVFNPERELVIADRASGLKVTRKLDPDVAFRCTECQFDTLDLKVIKEHVAVGNHGWSYTPFKNPYGHCDQVTIEGIEDYAAFLQAEKEK